MLVFLSFKFSLESLYKISASLLSSFEPSMNHNNSETTDFHASFLVVIAGKPFDKFVQFSYFVLAI